MATKKRTEQAGPAAEQQPEPTYTPTYSTVTTAGDFGLWVSKLVLALPAPAGVNDITPAAFNVFCARHELADGAPLLRKEHGSERAVPSRGFVPVLAAYPSDAAGNRVERGRYAALELPEVRVTKKIEGGVLGSRCVENRFRITQLVPLPGEHEPVSGLVFEQSTGDVCPQLAGWAEGEMSQAVDGFKLKYGYYTPSFEPIPQLMAPPREVPQKAALLVWLHGAGEGQGDTPGEPIRAYAGNRVSALSQNPIQGYFGGAAWVLVPQAPTFWMDDGVEQMGRSNESVYVRALKACIDEFVAAHAERIDPGRIVVGGLSNGGFMTVRMCLDYPGFFSAAIPTCAPFYEENQTPEAVAALAQTPMWFVHSKGDELVDPTQTALPLYHRLKAAGAEVHMTYFDHVEDLTGVYREPDGRPLRTFNHGVWIHIFNDFCRTDLDGSAVLVDGEPVGAWEWAARQRR